MRAVGMRADDTSQKPTFFELLLFERSQNVQLILIQDAKMVFTLFTEFYFAQRDRPPCNYYLSYSSDRSSMNTNKMRFSTRYNNSNRIIASPFFFWSSTLAQHWRYVVYNYQIIHSQVKTTWTITSGISYLKRKIKTPFLHNTICSWEHSRLWHFVHLTLMEFFVKNLGLEVKFKIKKLKPFQEKDTRQHQYCR